MPEPQENNNLFPQMPTNGWASWARWLIALLVFSVLGVVYSARQDMAKLETKIAVHEERWNRLDERLSRIEADIRDHHRDSGTIR